MRHNLTSRNWPSPQQAYAAATIRAAEAPLLAVGKPLMEQAAFAVAVRVRRVLRTLRGRVGGANVVVLVGAGNNGGDGLHVAAELAKRGVQVLVVLTSDQPHAGGLARAQRADVQVVELAAVTATQIRQRISTADVVVDALVGIGGDGRGVRGAAGALVTQLAQTTRPFVVALDVPSGIGVDDGALAGAVLPADLTVTLGALKPGLLLPPANAVCGRVELVDIGLDLSAATPAAQRPQLDHLWPVPHPQSHKYTRGVLGVVAGTAQYPGAGLLVCRGALAAGVGMIRFLAEADGGPPADPLRTDPLAALVVADRPEVVVGSGQVQAWVVGPGIGLAVGSDTGVRAQQVAEVLRQARSGVPAVVDAGALDQVEGGLGPQVVLTPHAGELARLLTRLGIPADRATVETSPVWAARAAQQLTGATVLLKGPTTVVVSASRTATSQTLPPEPATIDEARVLVAAPGPSWLATAGSGDVLAGVLGALLAGSAQRLAQDPHLAAELAILAATVHAAAARTGPVAAGDLPAQISAAVQALPAVAAAQPSDTVVW